MLENIEFHPETRNLTPETNDNFHSSKNLAQPEAALKSKIPVLGTFDPPAPPS